MTLLIPLVAFLMQAAGTPSSSPPTTRLGTAELYGYRSVLSLQKRHKGSLIRQAKEDASLPGAWSVVRIKGTTRLKLTNAYLAGDGRFCFQAFEIELNNVSSPVWHGMVGHKVLLLPRQIIARKSAPPQEADYLKPIRLN